MAKEKSESTVLRLGYPCNIVREKDGPFRVSGPFGKYEAKGVLKGVRFDEAGESVELEIVTYPVLGAVRPQFTVSGTVSSDIGNFQFDDGEYRFYKTDKGEWTGVFREGSQNRPFKLGSIDDPESNLRLVLDATPMEEVMQKDIYAKLPQRFSDTGQLTKSCYTVLQRLGYVQRTGKLRTMRIRKLKGVVST